MGTLGMKQVTLRHPQVRPTRAGLLDRRWGWRGLDVQGSRQAALTSWENSGAG